MFIKHLGKYNECHFEKIPPPIFLTSINSLKSDVLFPSRLSVHVLYYFFINFFISYIFINFALLYLGVLFCAINKVSGSNVFEERRKIMKGALIGEKLAAAVEASKSKK